MKPGATGKFPLGKLSPEDEGELQFSMRIDEKNQLVMINFGKPVAWFGLRAEEAEALAKAFLFRAAQLRGIIPAADPDPNPSFCPGLTAFEFARLVEWLDDPDRKSADTAFTSGHVRDAARAYEQADHNEVHALFHILNCKETTLCPECRKMAEGLQKK